MRKEVVVAVSIGLILGLIITYGFYQARSTVETIGRVAQDDTLQSPPAASDAQLESLGTLTLASPEDESVTDNQQVTIAGTTTAGSLVVIFIGEKPTVTTADDSGSFSITTELSNGGNVITVHAVDEDGRVSKQERVVVLTTEEFVPVPDQQNGSDDGSAGQDQSGSAGFDLGVSGRFAARFADGWRALVGRLAKPAYAQSGDASPEVSPEVSPSGRQQFDPNATRKLKERIERIVDEKKDQIKGVLSQIGQQRRGFIGEVERISQETITLETPKGLSIIPLTEKVVLEENGRGVEVDDIEVGNWATVLGVSEEETFQPLKVVIFEDSLRPRPIVVAMGSVVDVSSAELNIVRRDTGEELTFELNRQTAYQDLVGDQLRNDDMSPDLQVLVAGLETASGKTALVVRLLTTLDDQSRP